MNTFKHFLFAVILGICTFIWFGVLITALTQIREQGLLVFVLTMIISSVFLSVPVAISSLVLGIRKSTPKSKVIIPTDKTSNNTPKNTFDVNEEFERFKMKNENEEIASDLTITKEIIPITPPKLKEFTFNVVGVTMENDKKQDIQRLLYRKGKMHCDEHGINLYGGWSNKEILECDVSISEFEDLTFHKEEISFVPEPTNEYDPNAIKVFINFDGDFDHIGYVPKKETQKLSEILQNEEVVRITTSYGGGKTKEVDYDEEKDKEVVRVKDLILGVRVEIFYK